LTLSRKLTALAYGAACHLLWCAAIALMAVSLFGGMQLGLGPFRGWSGELWNLLLVAQFPVIHSFLLSKRGRRVLRSLAPRGLGDDLSSTTYAILASLQLLAVFGLWSPSGHVWWRPEGIALAVSSALFGLSWLFLAESMREAGLGLQAGYLGWTSVFRGRAPRYPRFRETGLFRFLRQPTYLAFALVLWTAPAWTPDRLFLATGWSLYCYFGPRLKELRYVRHYGDDFRRYQEAVSYWFPRRRGA
jgi:protein-S-isoprenylcysteine O-methyltransferase Ste14